MVTEKERQALSQYAAHHASRRIGDLFTEQPSRTDLYSWRVGPLYFDFARQPIEPELLLLLQELAAACELDRWRDDLFAGEIVNASERRPALHTALRASSPPAKSALGDAVASRVRSERDDCYRFAEAVRSGAISSPAGTPYRHLVHLGIGGSYLGPKLLTNSLNNPLTSPVSVHFVSNIDGHVLTSVLSQCDPEETLILAASKTFTTQETLTNLHNMLDWLGSAGIAQPRLQVVAITTATERALQAGIPQQQIFGFADWVGGRYSVWSSVSLSAMIALGTEVFDQFLAGAELMDRHFCSEPLPTNAPMLAGALDYYFSSVLDAETRAVFPYDARLADLVPYLQQLQMESNGKRSDLQGQKISWPTAPVIWGGVGTDVQHAVFQLVHQGTHSIPTEFIAVQEPDHHLGRNHDLLLANCLAQSAALMYGRGDEFPGNQPSTTLLLDRLNAYSLGALLAFYEHRTLCSGVLWGVNPFDQPGVELGKVMAREIADQMSGGNTDVRLDSSTMKLLRIIGEGKK